MPNESIDAKPPYVTFATFNNYILSVREAGVIPSRIDRSVLPGMAGGVQTYLIAALRYLGLVDDQKIPTEDFKLLIEAKEEDARKAQLKRILERSYGFIFNKGIDLKRATDSQLTEAFKATGAGGDTIRKCISFFCGVANSAGLELGPHLKAGSRGGSGGAPRSAPRRKPRRKGVKDDREESPTSSVQETISDPKAMLMKKFPDFDPSWKDEIKAAWFKDFSELRKWMQNP